MGKRNRCFIAGGVASESSGYLRGGRQRWWNQGPLRRGDGSGARWPLMGDCIHFLTVST